MIFLHFPDGFPDYRSEIMEKLEDDICCYGVDKKYIDSWAEVYYDHDRTTEDQDFELLDYEEEFDDEF